MAEEISSIPVTALGTGHIDRKPFERVPYGIEQTSAMRLQFFELAWPGNVSPHWYMEQPAQNYPFWLPQASNATTSYTSDWDNFHTYDHRHWIDQSLWGEGKVFFPVLVSLIFQNFQDIPAPEKGLLQKWYAGLRFDLYGVECEADTVFMKEIGTEYNYILRETITGLDFPPMRSGTYWHWFKQYDVFGVKIDPTETIVMNITNCAEIKLNAFFCFVLGIAADV